MGARRIPNAPTDGAAFEAWLLLERWRAEQVAAAVSVRTTSSSAGDWIPLAQVPGGKKSKRRKARTGELEAKKINGRWYARSTAVEQMGDRDEKPANDDGGDDAVRHSLGLTPRRAR